MQQKARDAKRRKNRAKPEVLHCKSKSLSQETNKSNTRSNR